MDHAAAAASWKRIQEHQFAQSADGQMLNRVLVGCCRELIPIPPFKGLPEAAMNYNLGEGLAGELGVSAGGFARHVVRLTGAFYRLSLRIPGGRVLRGAAASPAEAVRAEVAPSGAVGDWAMRRLASGAASVPRADVRPAEVAPGGGVNLSCCGRAPR